MGYMSNQQAGVLSIGSPPQKFSLMDDGAKASFWQNMADMADRTRLRYAMTRGDAGDLAAATPYGRVETPDIRSAYQGYHGNGYTTLTHDDEIADNAEMYYKRYRDMGLDKADALSYLRYAPIFGSLYEMYNDDNLVNPEPYANMLNDTLARARIGTDPAMAGVRYERINPMAQAAAMRSQMAQGVRSIASAYGNRPGLAAGAIANMMYQGNQAIGNSLHAAQLYNNNIQRAEDQANFDRWREWQSRRNAAQQYNSQLESSIGSAVAGLYMDADEANRQTRFGNRQNFYRNLGLLGQDERNKWMAGVSALNGMESAGYHTPYEKP